MIGSMPLAQSPGATPNPELLAQLRDIHPAAAPGWWPPAPGWWLLALVVIAALGWVGWRAWQRWRLRRRRAAWAGQIDAAMRLESEAEQLERINTILKIVALRAFPKSSARSLSGTRWSTFLAEHASDEGGDAARDETAFALLARGPYQARPQDGETMQALRNAARRWVLRHG